ncbi:MAG TPA: ATP-binding protein [Acidimicrobiales bacterium]|nr:ATP-binding protein [Acidimicrobiales bacterium]
MNHRMGFSRLALAVLVLAVAVAVGLFAFSRDLNQRDARRLLSFQASDARTSVTSLLAEIESDLSSVGSVAGATDASPGALDKLVTEIPSLSIFTTLTVVHTPASGGSALIAVRGNPGSPLGALSGASDDVLAKVESSRGIEVITFLGHGAGRRLALSVGAPAIPAGYSIYAEVPLPEGTTIASGFPGLQEALYLGRTESSPVLFASTKTLPLSGQTVRQLVDLNALDATSAPRAGAGDLLFVVSSSGSTLGTLPNLLPWLLAVVALLAGILVAFVVEWTARRRDSALRLVGDLEQKNAALDHAMAEQAEAERVRVRLEGELRQSQRLEAVGQLAGGVAHDFNNLLMVISSHIEFMAEELPEDHPVQADLTEVRSAAGRAAELTRQLLVFSRRDLVKPSVLDVNAAISDVVSLLRRTVGEDVALHSVLAPDLPRVVCDPGELQQVLMNLVVNARQAIEAGGTITVETSAELIDEDAASVHAELQPGSYVRINVTDTGCGMSPETVSRVFEPYFTTKDPGSGTGLGLSTVYAIVSRYGGYVTVYSEIDVGTTFKIYLPSTDEELQAPTEQAPSEAPGEARGMILVVEDEAGVRSACRRILERAGFGVIEANDGVDALAKLNGLRIDLLLTDVVMPGGMTGRDLAAQVDHLRPGVPVLFMSGYNADAIATRGVLEPGITVVEKPFTSADLLSKVRELLSLPG